MSKQKHSKAVDFFKIETGHPLDDNISPAIVGGKAYGLIRMVNAAVRLPPAFVLSTHCCRQYFKNDNQLPDEITKEIKHHVHWLENTTNKSFNSKRNPLIVSVRSGAPLSMPGMMETLLNIGLNDETVKGMIRSIGNPRLAWDSYRRLIQSYAEIIHMAEPEEFDRVLKSYLKRGGLKDSNEMSTVSLKNLCQDFKQIFRSLTGDDFPQDPWIQLFNSITVVFESWLSKRADKYRTINKIDPKTGTACLIQAMVFGNSGGNSGSGVGFTRNPADGNNELYIDYLSNAQGEDIVSGRHNVDDIDGLQQKFPILFSELQQIKQKLEFEFSDMQDFEFTVQQGELYMLQTRNGKRTPLATLKIAIDLVNEGIIETEQALRMINDVDLKNIFTYELKCPPETMPIASGIIASTGIVSGVIALDEEKAREYSEKDQTIVLIRQETSTEDIGAMNLVDAVITITGGRTSHAAVVARQLGTACIVGCHNIKIDLKQRCIYIDNDIYSEGDHLTVDADHGHVYAGQLDIEKRPPTELIDQIRKWQSRTKTVSVSEIES